MVLLIIWAIIAREWSICFYKRGFMSNSFRVWFARKCFERHSSGLGSPWHRVSWRSHGKHRVWHACDQSWLLSIDFILFIDLKYVQIIHIKIHKLAQRYRGHAIAHYSKVKLFMLFFRNIYCVKRCSHEKWLLYINEHINKMRSGVFRVVWA